MPAEGWTWRRSGTTRAVRGRRWPSVLIHAFIDRCDGMNLGAMAELLSASSIISVVNNGHGFYLRLATPHMGFQYADGVKYHGVIDLGQMLTMPRYPCGGLAVLWCDQGLPRIIEVAGYGQALWEGGWSGLALSRHRADHGTG